MNHSYDPSSCKIIVDDIQEKYSCQLPQFDFVIYIGEIFGCFLVAEILMQMLLLVKFKNYSKDKNFYRELQRLYKSIKRFIDLPKLEDLQSDRVNQKFAIEFDNCDLFLLFDCLRRKYDEKFATLVLVNVNETAMRNWAAENGWTIIDEHE